ncbi:MAG: ABC transporter ATP-binding protein [Bacteroidales bacterium]|jgi:ATP-binding cassette subfamily B protein|nr:ABC transporter ATP-binding protein [Bacteroidales bacterium]
MKQQRKIISRSLGMLMKSSGKETAFSLVILTVRSFLPLVGVLLIRYYVDRITGITAGGELPVLSAVTGLIAAMAATLLADDLLANAGSYFTRKQSVRVEGHISSLIHRHAAGMGLRFFEDPAFHDGMSRAARDISWRPAAMVADMILLARGVISFIAMGYVLRTFGVIPLAVLALLFLPLLWIRYRNSSRLYRARRSVTPLTRQAAYFSWLLTGEKPAREVKLFGLGNYFERLFRSNFDGSKAPELEAVRKNTLLESAASLVKVAAFAGILVYASGAFVRSEITAGELAMYLVAFRQALVYLRDAVSGYAGLAENRLFLHDLFNFLDMKGDMGGDAMPPESSDFSEIVAENVTFTYPGAKEPAVAGVNLKISSGEKIAVVGPNGSGKTTLVKLLCRLYDPDGGRILLNGRDITTLDPAGYRRLFSVVFQNFMLYFLTAGENIRLSSDARRFDEGLSSSGSGGDDSIRDESYRRADGRGNDSIRDESRRDDQRVREAAARAGIASLLESMPEGYDTMLGHHTEGGREMSWGEWQKIAIARALYRKAPVLILDEPSSSLDADSEYEIFSDLGRITDGRSCIFISHRLSNVREADRIIVLDRGRIAESGTHDELMAARGRYHEMYSRQKSMYR